MKKYKKQRILNDLIELCIIIGRFSFFLGWFGSMGVFRINAFVGILIGILCSAFCLFIYWVLLQFKDYNDPFNPDID